jgi:hypothetical protein
MRTVTVQELRELREMAGKLLIAARELPHGPNRQSAIQLIGQFRLQIAALRCPELGRPGPKPAAARADAIDHQDDRNRL